MANNTYQKIKANRIYRTLFLSCSLALYALIYPLVGEADRAESTYLSAVNRLNRYNFEHATNHIKRDIYQLVSRRTPGMTQDERWRFSKAVVRYSRERALDPYLLLAVIETESDYRADAVSNKGAVGFMQIRPFVAKAIAYEVNINPEFAETNLTDMDTNLRLGAYYLSKMKNRFGNLDLALMAYNLGPTELSRHLKQGLTPNMKYRNKVIESRRRIKRESRFIIADRPTGASGA